MLFEFYHLRALGAAEWIQNWRQHVEFVHSQGLGAHPAGLSLIAERNLTLLDRYFVGLGPLVVTTIVVGGLTQRFCDNRRIRTYSLFLLAAFWTHLCYWLLESIGWPRYAFNAILFACAILPIAILGVKASTARWAAALTIVFAILTGWSGLKFYTQAWCRPAWSWSRDDGQIQLDVAKYLDEERHSGVVYAPWWAHVASLEYLAKQPGQFSPVTAQSNAPGLLVINRRLSVPDSLEYAALTRRCRKLRTFEPDYEIHRCIPGAGWKPQ
jgi:hypothetical protein